MEQPRCTIEEFAAYVKALMQGMLDHPQDMRLTQGYDGPKLTFSIIVSKWDIGKVIGKQGRTARSLRTVVGASSMTQLGEHVSLDFVEAK